MLSRITAVFFCIMIMTGAMVVKAETKSTDSRIMILPFDGTSSGKFAYLTDSIRAMISSRLAAQNGVEIVDYSINAEEIKMLEQGVNLAENETVFSRFGTDYVLSGALYELQTGLKIQVSLTGSKLHDLQGIFSALAVNESKIIESVEGLVQDIVARGLGVQSGEFKVTGTEKEQGLAGFSTEHPEKLFKKGVYGGSIVAEGEVTVKSLGVRRSSPIPTMIVSMAAGDLDGDGTREIIAAARTSLEIYQFDDIRFRKLAEHDFGLNYKIHMVDVADLDGDGLQEIIISANNREQVSSAIYSWRSSGGLQKRLDKIPYYLRPITQPGVGLILAGQKGSDKPSDGFVGNGVFRMKIEAGLSGVSEMAKLGLPKNVNLFDFIWADIQGDGVNELVAVDSREKLLVYDSSNSLIWVSEDDFGGSRNFFGPTKSSVKDAGRIRGTDSSDGLDRITVFIPTRLISADMDGDGDQEIIVGRNARNWPKWISETREYDGGAVSCLNWSEGTMLELWHTNKITGYIGDYSLIRHQQPGDVQLYVAQVPERMMLGLLMNQESKLLRYSLKIEDVR